MDEQTKALLYSIADGIFSLLAENEKLQKENEELRAYKEQRAEMDARHLQIQMDTFNDIMSGLQEKKYRIYYKPNGGEKRKINEVFSNEFEAGKRCFWLNENALESVCGQFVYEEDKEQ